MRRGDLAELYFEAVLDADRGRALATVERALAVGLNPSEVIFELVTPCLDRMLGRLKDTGEATLAQHYVAARLANEITDDMISRMPLPPQKLGRVVLGTPRGDFHGLGRKIVGGCLRANMLDVIDLGLNVAPERFVDEAERRGAECIGISSMMVHTAQGPQGPRAVRALLDERGLSETIHLIVGGAPYQYDPNLAERVGADGWAPDGVEAVVLVKRLLAKPARRLEAP